ncbi:MAG: DinB family protein [Acidobacteriota bacterium]
MQNDGTFDFLDTTGLLARTPKLLDVWLRDLPEVWLNTDEGPGTFSPLEVVAHLLHAERTNWITRVDHILDRKPGTFPPFDPLGQRATLEGQTISTVLDRFAEARAKNLKRLAGLGLSEDYFELGGSHPAIGDVTLRQLLATWLVHDQGHIAQIARVLAKRYRREVGPWASYLTVLSDRTKP